MPFEVMAHHAVDFWLCGEDLPQPDNRVILGCKAHDLDNLYVVDTSFFPSIGAAMSGQVGAGARALYYLEVPPPLFGRIAQGIASAGRSAGARVMVEKPFGNDLESARQLNETMHTVSLQLVG